jgi:hypothetical protein
MTIDATTPQSRRALLAGALGGLAAAVATALGRPAPASAAAGSPMIVGSETNDAGSANTQLLTNSNVVAFKLLQNGPGTALMGYATPVTGGTRGVYGRSDSPNGFGVQGRNAGANGTGAAMQAIGVNNHGLDASATSVQAHAVHAVHDGGGFGVYGDSASGTAVFGSSTTGIGLSGYSTSDRALFASSPNGIAGSFAGDVEIAGGFLDMEELSSLPDAPPDHVARIYTRDNGANKTQLVVRFTGGATVVIAAEP